MNKWWEEKKDELLSIATRTSPCYVYSKEILSGQVKKLRDILTSVDKFFYAVKANWNVDILKVLYDEGFGFECVSPGEIHHILKLFPDISKDRILFTPNFVPKEEYIEAYSIGCLVTLDSIYPLQNWPEIFREKSVILRMDPGTGRGHHQHVKTAGNQSKFGILAGEVKGVAQLAKNISLKVIGLHSHAGSGILKESGNWSEVAEFLYKLKKDYFPEVQFINVGGGLGVVQNPEVDIPLDMTEVALTLSNFKKSNVDIQLWLEPGRFLVAECGVLLAKVTQIKEKETISYIGINTGFNSLIRPMLYNAYHHCINLTQLGKELVEKVHIVGIICESGDVFAKDRYFPQSYEGDIVLLATAGAYGRSMASQYNLRDPAPEIMIQ